MAEDEGRGEGGEDLFEDLDKFFAPIQDVDWPEPSERRPSQATGPRPPEQPAEPSAEPQVPAAGEPDDTAVSEEPIRIGEPEEIAEEPFEGAVGPTPGQEGLFVEEPEPSTGWEASSEDEEDEEDEQDEGDGVGAFLFETEAEGYDEVGEVSEEALAAPPAAYVDLPGPEGDEEAVAELIEEAPDVDEEAPDLEAVEAAAEHFAESVRGEVEVEPEVPAPPGDTEEVQIAALLGEEEEPSEGEPEPSRTVRVGGEGLGGPSWQEPTAMEIGADQDRRPGGRDVPMAFLTGLVLGGAALGALAIGAGPFAIFAGAIVLFAQGEFYFALQKRHYQPASALGLVSGALVLGAGYYRGEGAMLAIMVLSVFATFLWYMAGPPQHRRNVVTNVALTVLGVAYIPLLASYAITVLKLPDGSSLALAIIGLAFVYDTAAFGVGYFWGSRPLAPNVSPKKSWEGAIGATLVTVAVAVGAVAPSVPLLDTVGRAVGLAVVVAIFAPLGDLAESLLKRDLGIKDMGSILPGHGGVLDRIDSVLFVAPAAFLYLRLILL